MGFNVCILLILFTWINNIYRVSCYDLLVRPGYTRAISSSVGYGGYPNKTVDGDLRQNHYTYCMHTALGHTEAWLRIDLRKIYNIHSVKFWYRNDKPGENTKRIQGFSIRLSNISQTLPPNICYQDDGKTLLPPIIDKECKGVAQYVWIYTNKRDDGGVFLEICEVQVFGCSYQDGDGNCISCDQCNNDCNINGECDGQGCKIVGYRPPYCKECRNGRYGNDCSFSCGHCANNSTCNNITGSCPNKECSPGWKFTEDWKCDQECNNGTFGVNCISSCRGQCAKGTFCRKNDGLCPSACASGWQGSDCSQRCSHGHFGHNCQEICGICENNKTCDHINGSCHGFCEPGYRGEECQNTCSHGHFGHNCQEICGKCENNKTCDHINGSCHGFCEPGYRGEECQKKCKGGFYGTNCTHLCGHCSKNATCDHINGSCPDGYCEPGWKHTYEKRCDKECENGTYGLYCEHSCSGNCAGGLYCSKVNGYCPRGCNDGWIESYCNETCNDYYYGKNCSIPCGNCAKPSKCDHVNGSCPYGYCEKGWKNTPDKRCNIECDYGIFGNHCMNRCSGHCTQGLPCTKDDGVCREGCADGWENDKCNETCRTHFYGKNCSFPCGHCANNATCDHVTGSCPSGLCKRGWKNTSDKRCDEGCENGTFGLNCQSKCSGHCVGGWPCNKVDGLCTEGCAVGWINPYCNDTTKQASECNLNQIVRSSLYGTIAALFLSLLLNIFLIVRNAKKAFYMRQSSKKGNKEQDSTINTYVNAPGRNEENTAYQELTVQLNNLLINDTEESNAGYQELGELSQPSHYEELKRF